MLDARRNSVIVAVALWVQQDDIVRKPIDLTDTTASLTCPQRWTTCNAKIAADGHAPSVGPPAARKLRPSSTASLGRSPRR